MAVTISGTSGINTPAEAVSGPISVGPQGITFADATVQTTAAGSPPVVNVYTSPGAWTKPATVKSIKVTVVGGGGNGGSLTSPSPSSYITAAGGGGGGGAAIKNYPAPSLSGPQPYTVGTAGNSSSFGVAPSTVVSATGGTPNAGAGGVGTNGDLNIPGGRGMVGIAPSTGGTGADSYLSTIVGGYTAPNGGLLAGSPGNAYGGGGAGASQNKPTGPAPFTTPGGTGATGVVIIEEFY